MRIGTKTVIGIFLLTGSLLAGHKMIDPNIFPKAEEGVERYVIVLPQKQDETRSKIELVVGSKQQVDCNQHWLRGKIEKKNLKGWGYSYYVVKELGPGISTRRACQEAPSEKFVTMAPSPEGFLRYNSKVPIVVYVPKGYELRYRLWSTDGTLHEAAKR